MNISICIIAKNEEENIERCLKSIVPYPFEIIVADTGSTDRTREIALQYTNCVYDFTWCDDFATARNFAISKAKNPFVLALDSDEYIDFMDADAFFKILSQHPDDVGRIQRINILTRKNEVQEKKEWINRVFAKEKYHYEGRIHEQIEAINGGGYSTYQLPFIIRHTGYDLPPWKKKEKAYRNIGLLQKELEYLNQTGTNEKMPYILYQIGKGYYMAEEYETACRYFSEGLSFDLDPRLEYVIDMVETYGYALLNSGQAGQALLFENIYKEFGGSADFQFLMGLIYMNNAQFESAVCEFEKAVRHRDCKTSGVNSYASYYNIGVIYECRGHKAKAEQYYKLCGSYKPALEQLKKIKE